MLRSLKDLDGCTRQVIQQSSQSATSSQDQQDRGAKREFGTIYWDVETDRGDRHFICEVSAIASTRSSQGRYLVIDIDGNRFEIPHYQTRQPQSSAVGQAHLITTGTKRGQTESLTPKKQSSDLRSPISRPLRTNHRELAFHRLRLVAHVTVAFTGTAPISPTGGLALNWMNVSPPFGPTWNSRVLTLFHSSQPTGRVIWALPLIDRRMLFVTRIWNVDVLDVRPHLCRGESQVGQERSTTSKLTSAAPIRASPARTSAPSAQRQEAYPSHDRPHLSRDMRLRRQALDSDPLRAQIAARLAFARQYVVASVQRLCPVVHKMELAHHSSRELRRRPSGRSPTQAASARRTSL